MAIKGGNEDSKHICQHMDEKNINFLALLDAQVPFSQLFYS